MMISRWYDHTRRIASGVPMPAERGSPPGPNQWFWGAPVVLALRGRGETSGSGVSDTSDRGALEWVGFSGSVSAVGGRGGCGYLIPA